MRPLSRAPGGLTKSRRAATINGSSALTRRSQKLPQLFPMIDVIALGIGWLVGAWLVGAAAGRRGFRMVLWGVAALVISPVLAIILLLLVTPAEHPRRPR